MSRTLMTVIPVLGAILVAVALYQWIRRKGSKNSSQTPEQDNTTSPSDEGFSAYPTDDYGIPADSVATGALAPAELLPEGDAAEDGEMKTAAGANYLVAPNPITTIRNGNYDLRRAPEIETAPVGPWSQTTIGYDSSGISVQQAS